MCTGTHPFIPAPGIAKLQLIVLNDNQRTENTLHFHKETNWSTADLTGLASAVIGNWVTTVGAVTTVHAQLIRVICDDMSAAAGNHYEVSPSPALAGTDTGSPLPNNCAFKLRFGTGKRGKSFRGGPYHTGLTDNGLTYSELSPTRATAIRDAWQNFTDTVGTTTSSLLYIVSYCGSKAWRTTALSNQVHSIDYFDLTIDSQRRRLPGRGS